MYLHQLVVRPTPPCGVNGGPLGSLGFYPPPAVMRRPLPPPLGWCQRRPSRARTLTTARSNEAAALCSPFWLQESAELLCRTLRVLRVQILRNCPQLMRGGDLVDKYPSFSDPQLGLSGVYSTHSPGVPLGRRLQEPTEVTPY